MRIIAIVLSIALCGFVLCSDKDFKNMDGDVAREIKELKAWTDIVESAESYLLQKTTNDERLDVIKKLDARIKRRDVEGHGFEDTALDFFNEPFNTLPLTTRHAVISLPI